MTPNFCPLPCWTRTNPRSIWGWIGPLRRDRSPSMCRWSRPALRMWPPKCWWRPRTTSRRVVSWEYSRGDGWAVFGALDETTMLTRLLGWFTSWVQWILPPGSRRDSPCIGCAPVGRMGNLFFHPRCAVCCSIQPGPHKPPPVATKYWGPATEIRPSVSRRTRRLSCLESGWTCANANYRRRLNWLRPVVVTRSR